LSKGTADYVEFATSPTEILATLGGLFARPSKLIVSLIDPVKKAKKVQYDDLPMLLAYLSKVRSMFQEVRRLNVFNLFSNVNNVDAVLEKLPTAEVERWLEYSSDLNDNQLATALEKFVIERWTYTTTLVSQTTSADQALKSMGIGGGGGGGSQQGGARPGSPKNNNKNNKKSWWEAKKKADGNSTSQVEAVEAARMRSCHKLWRQGLTIKEVLVQVARMSKLTRIISMRFWMEWRTLINCLMP
jgi:hypothetical protein